MLTLARVPLMCALLSLTAAADDLTTRFSPESGRPIPAKVALPILRTLPDNGLARTPPMGWDGWNRLHGKMDDAAVRQVAAALSANGMRDAGYVYLIIDDTWQGQRDASGNIQPNSRFPDMKALAGYVHSKGLLLGIYSSPGPLTCAGYEGSYAHEEQDAKAFADWGVDYVKYDWCSAGKIYTGPEMRQVFQHMGEALQATSRPMVYSVSNGGTEEVWSWAKAAGANLWRTNSGIGDNWVSLSNTAFAQNGLESHSGWGRWNDPGMLQIGNGGMTSTEYKTQMTLWAMLAAPLIAGNDLRSTSPESLKLLTNKEVIAIDQDSLGKQASRLFHSGDLEIWTRPLSDGSVAVGWFNRGGDTATVTFDLHNVGIKGAFEVRDVWEHRIIDTHNSELTITLQPHDSLLLRVTPIGRSSS